MWTHPVSVLLWITIAFAVGHWSGARSKVWDWYDGYRAGREDQQNAERSEL